MTVPCELIDAATDEQETYSSTLSRSIRLARRLRRDGFRPGDVLMLGGSNHLDIHIPFYAAHFNGHPVVGVDPFYNFDEIKFLINLTKPKVAFCQHETYEDYARAAKELGLGVKIVTFGGGECSFRKYLEECEDEPLEEFKPADFDPNSVYCWLVSTSGTSGVPKVAAFHHQTVVDLVLSYMKITPRQQGQVTLNLNVAPVRWISAYYNCLRMLINYVKLQTSRPTDDIDHVIDIINKYKPGSTFASPPVFASILKNEKPCDLTCFKLISLSGSKVYKQLITDLKARMSPDAVFMETYAQTESLGSVLQPNPAGPVGSCGVPMSTVQVKLVNPKTGEEITAPNVTGELWTKGPRFACYYNNPEETSKAITEDGWYRTGDLLYRDEDNNYFYVDRLSMLIKYRSHHCYYNNPEETSKAITEDGWYRTGDLLYRDEDNNYFYVDRLSMLIKYRSHHVRVPHPEDGQHTVACVVVRPRSSLTAQDIKKMVADKLSAGKHLQGGVVFMKELPKTSTGKVARAKLKKMVENFKRE